jgi:DNA-binding response OmpR family regulator
VKRKILFIDDDKELSEEMVDLLAAEGCQVQVAFDGLGAEKLIKKNHYDVILLDIKMPVLNGADLLKRIKKISLKSKIILISGKPFLEKEIKKQGLLPMIRCFISKPYDVKILLNSIKSA